MKQLFTYSMALVLCLFFLFAGTGLNVVHYCCDACREAGIENVGIQSCNTIHEHERQEACCHHDDEEDHEGCSHHHDGCCWFKHLEVNHGGISSSLSVPEKTVIDLLYSSVAANNYLYSFTINADCEEDLQFDTSPNEDDNGRAVILRACTWLI